MQKILKRKTSQVLLLIGLALGWAVPLDAQEKRMSPELLWKLGRLGGTTLSADGNSAAYTVRRYELKENSGKSSLFLLDVKTGMSKALLEDWRSISGVQWIAQGDKELIYFVGLATGKSDGEATTYYDAPQVCTIDPASGKVTQVTSLKTGCANLKVSPTGKHIAFTVDIVLDKTVNQLFKDLPKADARIIDSLMYRHWDQWHDYAYSHIHVAALKEDGTAENAYDIMEGLKTDCPINPFGGSEQFTWSPEGNEIALTMKIVKKWAESTNSDVFLAKINADGSREGGFKNVSYGMMGYDNDPSYSPDGRYLGFHSMERASFESDRNRIMLYDRKSGKISDLSEGLDQNTHGINWTADSKSVYFTSEYRGTNQIFKIDMGTKGARRVSQGDFNWDFVGFTAGGKSLVVTKTSMLRPAEVHKIANSVSDSNPSTKLTGVNDDVYKGLELPTLRQRWVTATDGKKIHCWVIYPPGFDESKKYPMLLYCQGGPQGQIGQWFSYRWNFHLMASHGGYVVCAPNRRGLPGFGRAWNDQISKDWGGQAMKDLLSANDSMCTETYIDKKRVGAIGASFGGYTVYWMMGNAPERFATMIAHCGVFNLESMYGSTEELFFVNYDLGGPYWRSPEIQKDYNRFSPHKFVKNWKTPLLVIHGQKDFRVPVTQGMEAFTAAQVQGVESKFLYYPNEGHWVLGPQNGVLWHRVFFMWLEKYLK